MDDSNKLDLAAIIMASGFSSRMGFDKLNLKLHDGQTLFARTLNTIIEFGRCSEIIVVAAKESILQQAREKKVLAIFNPAPERGQSNSIILGVAAAQANNYMFVAADQPFLDVGTLNSMASCMDGKNIIVPRYQSMPGNPTIFPACFREQLLKLNGDTGGKPIIHNNKNLVKYVDIKFKNALADIDETVDIKRLLKHDHDKDSH